MSNFFQHYNRDRLAKLPNLKAFSEALQANTTKDIFELETQFRELATTKFVLDLIKQELKELGKDPLYTPTPSSFSFLNLIDCEYCSIFLWFDNQTDFTKKTILSSAAGNRIYLSLTEEDVFYDLHVQDNPYPLDQLNPSNKITVKSKGNKLSFGETIKLRKDTDIVKFNESGKKNIIFLICYSKDESPFVREYDESTLLPIQIVVGNQNSSRIEHICRVLGELGHRSSIPILQKLLNHENHNVRWEAVKSIMLIDYESGIQALELLKNDPHPDVQKATKNSLTQYKNLLA